MSNWYQNLQLKISFLLVIVISLLGNELHGIKMFVYWITDFKSALLKFCDNWNEAYDIQKFINVIMNFCHEKDSVCSKVYMLPEMG